jgi:hypothetical protein
MQRAAWLLLAIVGFGLRTVSPVRQIASQVAPARMPKACYASRGQLAAFAQLAEGRQRSILTELSIRSQRSRAVS